MHRNAPFQKKLGRGHTFFSDPSPLRIGGHPFPKPHPIGACGYSTSAPRSPTLDPPLYESGDDGRAEHAWGEWNETRVQNGQVLVIIPTRTLHSTDSNFLLYMLDLIGLILVRTITYSLFIAFIRIFNACCVL